MREAAIVVGLFAVLTVALLSVPTVVDWLDQHGYVQVVENAPVEELP